MAQIHDAPDHSVPAGPLPEGTTSPTTRILLRTFVLMLLAEVALFVFGVVFPGGYVARFGASEMVLVLCFTAVAPMLALFLLSLTGDAALPKSMRDKIFYGFIVALLAAIGTVFASQLRSAAINANGLSSTQRAMLGPWKVGLVDRPVEAKTPTAHTILANASGLMAFALDSTNDTFKGVSTPFTWVLGSAKEGSLLTVDVTYSVEQLDLEKKHARIGIHLVRVPWASQTAPEDRYDMPVEADVDVRYSSAGVPMQLVVTPKKPGGSLQVPLRLIPTNFDDVEK
jgi:hypothetical protein